MGLNFLKLIVMLYIMGPILLYFLLFLMMYSKHLTICMKLISMNLFFVNISIKLDLFTLFLFVVIMVSSFILMYSFYYMNFSHFLTNFFLFKFLFVLSMFMIIVSNSGLLMFIGWDGLGITSYFLIIFYLNWKSNNSGMVTILTNRIGDTIMMFFLLYFFILCSDFYNGSTKNYSNCFIMIMFITMCLTKSSQFPFSTWLPMAMAAPTPISALVHSSTLVTAGIFLLIKFSSFLSTNFLLMFLFLSSIFTMLFSGFNSIMEMDLKKVVALSTLNQLSFMLLTLSNSMVLLTFFHLNSHAIFKSLLFLNVGILIHSMFSAQDKRMFTTNLIFSKLLFLSMMMSLISLMGFVFTAGFFSKDLIMEMFMHLFSSMTLVFLLFLLMSFTFIYSIRIMFTLMKNFSVKYNLMNNTFASFFFSMFPLCILSLAFSKVFFLNFISMDFLNFTLSILKLIFVLYFFSFLFILKNNLPKQKFIHTFSQSMFFLNYVTFYMSSSFNFCLISLKFFMEKSFMEIFSSKLSFNMNLNLFKLTLTTNYSILTVTLILSYFMIF